MIYFVICSYYMFVRLHSPVRSHRPPAGSAGFTHSQLNLHILSEPSLQATGFMKGHVFLTRHAQSQPLKMKQDARIRELQVYS